MATTSKKRHWRLGRVDDASARLVLDSFIRTIERYNERANEHWRSLAEVRAQPYEMKSYHLMNAVGYDFGAMLARTVESEIRAGLEGGADGLAAASERAVQELYSMMWEIESLRARRSTAVVSRAFRELENKLPEWVDPAAEIREALQGRGVYYNDFHYDVEQALADSARRLEGFLAWHSLPSLVSYRVPIELPMRWEAIPSGLEDLSENEERALLKEALRAANREAGQRGWYGLRREPLPQQDFFTALFWSNGAAAWFVDPWLSENLTVERFRGAKETTLDANYILVPFPVPIVAKIAPFMEDHPLFAYSYEAKQLGKYPEPTDANVRRAIRSIIDQADPAAELEKRALAALEWFNIFKKAKAGDPDARGLAGSFVAEYEVSVAFGRLFEQWFARERGA